MTPEQRANSGTEHGHQSAVFLWAWMAETYGFAAANSDNAYSGKAVAEEYLARASLDELALVEPLCLMHAVPNGGHRHKAVALAMKAEGVRPGVPDIALPTAIGGFHGLYVEMKKPGGVVDTKQRKWIRRLRTGGYCVAVCDNWRDAVRVIEAYLRNSHLTIFDLTKE